MNSQNTPSSFENSGQNGQNGHGVTPVAEAVMVAPQTTAEPVTVSPEPIEPIEPVVLETVNVDELDESAEAGASSAASSKERTSNRMLYRHPQDKMLGGVAGGLAESFNLDPSLVRILWVVLTIATSGAGLFAYAALWALLPVGTAQAGQEEPAALELNDRNVGRAAYLLIGLGIIWFLSNVGALPWLWSGFSSVMSLIFWPALLIGAGYLILRNRDGETKLADDLRTRTSNMGSSLREKLGSKAPSRDDVKAGMRSAKQRIPLKRTRKDRMFLGVCGGLGRTLGIDANLVRLIWVAFSIGSLGTGVLIYVLVGLLLPEEESATLMSQDDGEITIDATV